jgi:hypothetical protein
MRKSYRNKSRRGGGATVMPLSYYKPSAFEPSAPAGRDLLEAIPPLGVRPKIGGRRTRRGTKKQRKQRKHRKSKGGFVPSVMGGFLESASKYIVPLALFAGYKLMTRKGKRGSRRYTKRR